MGGGVLSRHFALVRGRALAGAPPSVGQVSNLTESGQVGNLTCGQSCPCPAPPATLPPAAMNATLLTLTALSSFSAAQPPAALPPLPAGPVVFNASIQGAGPVMEVSGGVVLPFTDEAVPEIDIEGGKVVVDPPAGLLAAGETKEA